MWLLKDRDERIQQGIRCIAVQTNAVEITIWGLLYVIEWLVNSAEQNKRLWLEKQLDDALQ